MAGRCTMTGLRSALERYLSMRQGLGYKYQQQARRLANFVSYMEECDDLMPWAYAVRQDASAAA